MKEGELSWCHSWSEVASDVRVTQWIPEEHQADEPWCSRLLLIHRAKGHIGPCYCTTSVSTANRIQQLVVIESYGIPGSISRPGLCRQRTINYPSIVHSLSWATRYHASGR